MGYDMERFVGYVNEGLLCCICRDVLQEPLQAPCEHAFCTSCIHGWLVQHNSCPEDRQFLDLSVLRPLYRYMRNDLNRLQLHCRNRGSGCGIVCSLESIGRHERECEYSQIPCSNSGCPIRVERCNLDSHLAVCEFQSRECPNGCGYAILSAGDSQHNCVAELRTELELLRSEMIYQMEEAKHEMQSRLDSQRRHMVQKESLLQNEIDELKVYDPTTNTEEDTDVFYYQVQLVIDKICKQDVLLVIGDCNAKSQMSKMTSNIQTLMATERQHRQELEQAEVEKCELLELMKNFQKDCLTPREGSKKTTHFQPLSRLESIKRKTWEATAI